MSGVQGMHTPRRFRAITNRELNALRLSAGMSNRKAAVLLGISAGAVEERLRAVKEKLGVETKAEMIAAARAQGLLGIQK